MFDRTANASFDVFIPNGLDQFGENLIRRCKIGLYVPVLVSEGGVEPASGQEASLEHPHGE